ncbi:Uncharacterized protein APZ42_002987 [Daphnia magna]|uniref:Uncharacterized protein n=1 Tax=Daphnia magna TaxID=35525 RepID=A0A164HWX9_9CRUS|nr:Uncharacterized protein APZ42_002987 [Daphnia magna]
MIHKGRRNCWIGGAIGWRCPPGVGFTSICWTGKAMRHVCSVCHDSPAADALACVV